MLERILKFSIQHPWVVAFVFGLIHGFGFASALTSAGLPRADLPLALLGFNVGVEIGQVGFVVLILLLAAAVSGDAMNYALGRAVGRKHDLFGCQLGQRVALIQVFEVECEVLIGGRRSR